MNKNNIENKIPIFFACDNNYAPFVTVVLESIKENSSKEYIYEIYILNNNISDEYKEIIKKYNKNNIRINFYSIASELEKLKEKLQIRDYYSDAIYYRLFIAQLFKEYDKAIYLDADIVVLEDISKLYNIDIEDFYLGVVKDDVANSFNEFIIYVENAIKVKACEYFNSGILLMNLKKLREDKILNKFFKLHKFIKFIVAPDQDYLNVICNGKVKYLDESWNKAPLDGIIINSETKLIHYKLTLKPWHYDNINGGSYFWHYASKTNFHDYMINLLLNYTNEQKQKDLYVEENLKTLAINETVRIKDYLLNNKTYQEILGEDNEQD